MVYKLNKPFFNSQFLISIVGVEYFSMKLRVELYKLNKYDYDIVKDCVYYTF